MEKSFCHRVIRRFCGERDGSVMVETVITLPLLVWALVATWEFFEVHRYRSAREKATYTIADLISREQGIEDVYIDNAMSLFDGISNDNGNNQLRISVVVFETNDPDDANDNEYWIRWSEVRGNGGFTALTTNDVRNSFDTLPIMNDGEDLILVEAASTYQPVFNVGLSGNVQIDTRLFTKPRFTEQLCYEAQSCYQAPS
ncbi:TadE/TadG family type IV pilus assembly protein [Roseovarius aestuarii]|uniref:TadE-like protein n=1 Tax=Roseovarius aestuarii TaxID=475083 RepID=A0A1X7BTN5_9RHOB|nr:hypothetical protein [Roseovarius aestuarii]SMC12589.1 hypothetical protein ROA7745_02417 [Roseovarius aestuarii]